MEAWSILRRCVRASLAGSSLTVVGNHFQWRLRVLWSHLLVLQVRYFGIYFCAGRCSSVRVAPPECSP